MPCRSSRARSSKSSRRLDRPTASKNCWTEVRAMRVHLHVAQGRRVPGLPGEMRQGRQEASAVRRIECAEAGA
jgi:hypothetical protein